MSRTTRLQTFCSDTRESTSRIWSHFFSFRSFLICSCIPRSQAVVPGQEDSDSDNKSDDSDMEEDNDTVERDAMLLAQVVVIVIY